jgi:hypothetical protein
MMGMCGAVEHLGPAVCRALPYRGYSEAMWRGSWGIFAYELVIEPCRNNQQWF